MQVVSVRIDPVSKRRSAESQRGQVIEITGMRSRGVINWFVARLFVRHFV